MRPGVAVALLVVAACGFRPGARSSDGRPPDAAVDAPAPPADAAVFPHAEVVAGAGRLHAGAITIDVEVGRAVAVTHGTAGSITIEGQPVVKP
jgi:hypothetical protein